MSAEWVAIIAGVVVALVAAPLIILALMADEDRGRHRADDDLAPVSNDTPEPEVEPEPVSNDTPETGDGDD